ncbi:MAG TPA: putative toxin-antitoxin system toxin component, PIN family [Patescibacteria group bacterium]|nr:putative toxin-antitoxin system toxin component, PIN family [Patescibacteria group bacterium]
MKLVIDSSVWIAGIGSSKGYASEVILKSYKSSDAEIYISSQILSEITKNLIQKLRFDDNFTHRARNVIRDLCDYEIELGSAEIGLVRATKYQKDKHVLALCHKVRADYLITFDRKHLLPLVEYGKTKILEPKNFIEKCQKTV